MTKKWGKTGVYFSLHDLIMVQHERKLGKKLTAGTWSQKVKHKHCIAGFIAWFAQPALCLAVAPAPMIQDIQHQSLIKENALLDGDIFSIEILHFPENYN